MKNPLTSNANSFFLPFLPQSEYDKLKHHRCFDIIGHMTRTQFPDLFNFFDKALDARKELLNAKLNMAFDNKVKLEILREDSIEANLYFKDKDALRLYTDRLFFSIEDYDTKMKSEIESLPVQRNFLGEGDLSIFDLIDEVLESLLILKTEINGVKDLNVDDKIKTIEDIVIKLKSSSDLLPGIEEIEVPEINSVQKIYFVALYLGSKKIWMDHLKVTKANLEQDSSVPSSNESYKESQKIKPIQVSFSKDIEEGLYKALKDYFPETESKLFADLLGGNPIKGKLSFEMSGKRLGFVFRQLVEGKKIKLQKKDLMEWLQENFLYYNSKTKLYTAYSEDYLKRIMYHKDGIPPKISRIDISDLLS